MLYKKKVDFFNCNTVLVEFKNKTLYKLKYSKKLNYAIKKLQLQNLQLQKLKYIFYSEFTGRIRTCVLRLRTEFVSQHLPHYPT